MPCHIPNAKAIRSTFQPHHQVLEGCLAAEAYILWYNADSAGTACENAAETRGVSSADMVSEISESCRTAFMGDEGPASADW
ncbi:hypothetical protein VTL71DRAFT_8751, partial [Oculimacula yallundae]